MSWCAFSGLCVLIVDQWIETGGTMKAAIKLVERQGASVVGKLALFFKWIHINWKYKQLKAALDQENVSKYNETLICWNALHKTRTILYSTAFSFEYSV